MTGMKKEDIGLLLISLLIAIGLWFNVAISRQESIAEKQILGINLRIDGVAEKLSLEYQPVKVDVVLQGHPRALSKINAEDLITYIDLTGYTEGKWFVTPQGRIPDPLRVRIVKIIPDRIEVVLKSSPSQKIQENIPKNTTLKVN